MAKKGRPSNNLLKKYSYNFDELKNYYDENNVDLVVNDNDIFTTNNEQGNEQPVNQTAIVGDTKIANGNTTDNSGNVAGNSTTEPNLNDAFKIDVDKLIKLDIVGSAIVEAGLNLFGVKKEIEVINKDEAEMLLMVMPEIRLSKSWTNFLISYLMIKIFK